MTQAKHNILLPIEIINRELDARLFLGAMLARPDRRIYIGNENRINRLIPKLDGGVYVGKHITYVLGNSRRWYDPLKANGFKLIYIHEEGGIYPGREANWRRQLDWYRKRDIDNFDPEDYICNWGDFQTGHYRETLPERADRIMTTGHPRFDIYRDYPDFYKREADVIRQRFGKMVLVNTNFAYVVHNAGWKATFSKELGYVPDDPSRIDPMLAIWAHGNNVLVGLVQLVHQLAREFTDVTFVVRPHPSEDISFHQAAFHGVKNIHVEHSGAVGPWILASNAMLHDGCTTAVESYLMGKTPISYKPMGDLPHDIVVPNDLSISCANLEQVSAALRNCLENDAQGVGMIEPSTRASALLENIEQPAMPLLIRVMEQALEQAGPPRDTASSAKVRLREWQSVAREAPRTLTRRFSRRRRQREYDLQKFPGFDARIIADKCERIRALTGRSFNCKVLSDQLLTIEADTVQ